jgi:hypothetical protein
MVGSKRKLFIAGGITGIGLIVGIIVLISCTTLKKVTPLSSDLQSQNENPQRLEQTNQSEQQSEKEVKPSDNNSNKIDTNDIKFLFKDIVESVDWEWFQLRLKDPKQVVKIPANGGLPYYKLAKFFDKSSLPEFYEVLNDSNSSGYERLQAINFIGQISDIGNQEAANKLKDYVKQKVNWEKWKGDNVDDIVYSKWAALDWLGYVGGEQVEDFLKEALKPDGIKELVKQWYKEVPSSAFSEKGVLDNIRGHAAKGLAYSGKPEIQELIRAEYEREKEVCIRAGLIGDYYFNQLIEAVTRIDIIKDIGIEGHRALYDGKGSSVNIYLKYQRKYLLSKPDGDKVLKIQS